MSNNENIQSVLQILKELDKTNSFEIYLPSLQKSISFKQLNTEQLKKLLKTIIDSPIHNSEFINSFNSIIKENILDEVVNVDELNIFDKLLILIKTRIESISPDYIFNLSEEENTEFNLSEKTFSINLSGSYDTFIKDAPIFDKEIIKSGTYEITASLPTLQTENRLEKELYKNVKLEITTPEELRNTIGDTFINELTKYIIELKIGDTIIDLNTLTFKNRIKIVEQLPTSAINGVLKYVEKYKNFIKPLVTYTNNGVEKDIPQDATFFNM
jgi:hypothetical protein